MLGKIKNLLLGDRAYAESASNPEERQQLALASLLVEVARADFSEGQVERQEIVRLLAAYYELSDTEAKALLNRAKVAMNDAVCLFDFTRALHSSLDAEERQSVIRLLWHVALADNKLDRYEDYLVRKVADLMYVRDSDVMRIKHEVMDGSG